MSHWKCFLVCVLTDFPGHFGRRLQRLDWENPAVHVCRAICLFFGSGNNKQEEGRRETSELRGNCCGFSGGHRMTEFWVCFSCCIAEQPQPVSLRTWMSDRSARFRAQMQRWIWTWAQNVSYHWFRWILSYVTTPPLLAYQKHDSNMIEPHPNGWSRSDLSSSHDHITPFTLCHINTIMNTINVLWTHH